MGKYLHSDIAHFIIFALFLNIPIYDSEVLLFDVFRKLI